MAETDSSSHGQFISDIEEIRRRARQHIENGAVTDNYRADRNSVIRILNESLATENFWSMPRKNRNTLTRSQSESHSSTGPRTSTRKHWPRGVIRSMGKAPGWST
jgi:hypothetical protein